MIAKPVNRHDSYGAWRDKKHDGLVLALCLFCRALAAPIYADPNLW